MNLSMFMSCIPAATERPADPNTAEGQATLLARTQAEMRKTAGEKCINKFAKLSTHLESWQVLT